MFHTTTSLATGELSSLKISQDARLIAIQGKQQTENENFEQQLNEQKILDRQNLQLINQNVDLLQRLLMTEQEEFKSAIEPLETEIQQQIEDHKAALKQFREDFLAKINENERQMSIQISQIEQQLKVQTLRRQDLLKLMRAEFIKSISEIDDIINKQEQDKKFETEKLMNYFEQCKQRLTTTFDEAAARTARAFDTEKEQFNFNADLTHRVIEKTLLEIQEAIRKIEEQCDKKRKEHVEIEGNIVNQIENITLQIKNNLNGFIKVREPEPQAPPPE